MGFSDFNYTYWAIVMLNYSFCMHSGDHLRVVLCYCTCVGSHTLICVLANSSLFCIVSAKYMGGDAAG
jgi:hypothetical protein